ncbi:MAG: hypothetical protein WD468_07330 [Pirellulales bacterium]
MPNWRSSFSDVVQVLRKARRVVRDLGGEWERMVHRVRPGVKGLDGAGAMARQVRPVRVNLAAAVVDRMVRREAIDQSAAMANGVKGANGTVAGPVAVAHRIVQATVPKTRSNFDWKNLSLAPGSV